jgi:hypothetical protein
MWQDQPRGRCTRWLHNARRNRRHHLTASSLISITGNRRPAPPRLPSLLLDSHREPHSANGRPTTCHSSTIRKLKIARTRPLIRLNRAGKAGIIDGLATISTANAKNQASQHRLFCPQPMSPDPKRSSETKERRLRLRI